MVVIGASVINALGGAYTFENVRKARRRHAGMIP